MNTEGWLFIYKQSFLWLLALPFLRVTAIKDAFLSQGSKAQTLWVLELDSVIWSPPCYVLAICTTTQPTSSPHLSVFLCRMKTVILHLIFLKFTSTNAYNLPGRLEDLSNVCYLSFPLAHQPCQTEKDAVFFNG